MPKLEVEKTEELIPEVLKEEEKKVRVKKQRLEPDDLLLLSKVLAAGTNGGNPKEIIRSELEKELIKHDLTTSSALAEISTVMHYSRKELNRMQAAKIALELNGVLKDNKEVGDQSQVVQFIFNDKVDLNGIFNPKR